MWNYIVRVCNARIISKNVDINEFGRLYLYRTRREMKKLIIITLDTLSYIRSVN